MEDYSNAPRVTRYIAKRGDPVWVRIGVGWCAGHIIDIKRGPGPHSKAVVKFVTGAREVREWHELRFRDGDSK